MASPTTWKGMTYPAHGGAVNAWDTPLNADFDQIDTMLGGTLGLVLGSSVSTVNLTATQTWYQQFSLTGVLANNTTITLLSSVSGGIYCIDNQTTGSFAVSITTSSSLAGAGVQAAQGGNTLVNCNGTTVELADDTSLAAIYTQLGTPNGSVAGTAGAANGAATDAVYDQTNKILYATTTTGSSATAVWTAVAPSFPSPMGMLTANNSSLTPIPTGDILAATNIFYQPYNGNWTVLSNGTTITPYQMSARFQLTLTTAQAASQIYDVFMYRDATAGVIIGTGPSWAAGGGSVTAGSCARGTGAGSTALAALNFIWVNSVQVTLTNGASTYTCPASQGVYLGSIFMDTSAGQVTCHRSWGQSRKWGVWSLYNRLPVYLKAGDSTATWIYNTNTFRAANGNSANSLTVFQGLAEDIMELKTIQAATGSFGNVHISGAIGVNSTTTPSGGIGGIYVGTDRTANESLYIIAPIIGINVVTLLEKSVVAAGNCTFLGTEASNLITAKWRA